MFQVNWVLKPSSTFFVPRFRRERTRARFKGFEQVGDTELDAFFDRRFSVPN
jgi:hypothetical protein